jgi:DNA-binding transcriptional LysR family regulator
MEDFKGLKKGKITVGGSGFAGSCFLPLAVQEFKNQYPAIDVTLKIDRSQALEKMLLDGTIDLAVLGRPSQCSHLFVEPYREADLVFVAPPNHPLTRKRSVSLQAIAKEPLIVSRDGSHVRSMLEQEFAARGLPFSPLLEIDIHQLGARDAEKNAVASGLGIGFLSGCYVESDVKAGRLKVLKVSELKLKRLISIAVHKNRRNSPHVQVFSEFLKRYEQ